MTRCYPWVTDDAGKGQPIPQYWARHERRSLARCVHNPRAMRVPLRPLRPSIDKHLIVLAAIVWAGVVGAGTVALLLYQASPGDPGVAVTRWPSQSSLPRVEGRPRLVMFLHPKCSCSRASIAEMQRLMTRLRGRVQPVVVMIQPDGFPEQWVHSDLWQSARRIVDVQVVVDPDAVEAERFGAQTSGHVVLYDGDGALLFSGGITPGRAHQGDSVGRSQILASLDGAEPGDSRRQSAVFGCGLFAHAAGAQQ